MGACQGKPAVVETSKGKSSHVGTATTTIAATTTNVKAVSAAASNSSKPRETAAAHGISTTPGSVKPSIVPEVKSTGSSSQGGGGGVGRDGASGGYTSDHTSGSSGSGGGGAHAHPTATNFGGERPRFGSYASGASSYASGAASDDDDHSSNGSSNGSSRQSSGRTPVGHNGLNPRVLAHSTSAIGLDEMIDDRRELGDLRQNVVHIEIPFGKPIEEVYDGIHTGPVLGSGISGLVRLVTHKATGLKYAVKVLDLALVDTAEGLRQLREEIFIMCQLDHPNIVRLEEVYESHSEIYLVQELCVGGELFDRLDEQPDYHYTEAECARLVKQMLSAVRYLHSRGIIHRDLKLENFLFSSTAEDSELKMIDFGLSKHFRYGEVQREAVGTPYTVAPEVIRGCYDERCDIWAIGVIAFLLLSGDPPFGGCGGPEPLMTVRSNILKGLFRFEPEDIWSNVSSLARDFIRALLVTDPQKRPTARGAQKHRWLQEWASRSRKGKDNVLNPNVVKALVNFKEFSDMRKLLCEVLSFTLLPDQIKDLRREFEKMDTDGSGEISLSALKQVLMTNAGAGSLGALTEEEVEDIFNAMRVRKTETRIHWHEFIAAGLSQCQVDDRNLRLAFDRLDSDHKGYIILDDIMDLMGSDAVQSEEAMRRMWGDSIRAVKCSHARITYEDFLLLMKGQTKDVPTHDTVDLAPVSSMVVGLKLEAVPEMEGTGHEGDSTAVADTSVSSGEGLASEDHVKFDTELDNSNHTPNRSSPPQIKPSQSAPTTPADHKRILDLDDLDSPFSMDADDDDDAFGMIRGDSLVPPPLTKSSTAPSLPIDSIDSTEDADVTVPGISSAKPAPYSRRRSRSVDDRDEDGSEEKDAKDLHQLADAVRDLLLPETDHSNTSSSERAKDETKSALIVNRKLYRAHRQMRLAVLEASKRFEEQQAAHAREVILAQREAEGKHEQRGMIQAGLVMRHGHKKQVSSEAIRKMLQENQEQQRILVEKANRRAGRGRRSRKKTQSDMSGMLSSLGQDELGLMASAAADDSGAVDGALLNDIDTPSLEDAKRMGAAGSIPMMSDSNIDILGGAPVTEQDGSQLLVRKATVPGEFRKVKDPFSKQGLYGAARNTDLFPPSTSSTTTRN